MSDKKKELSFYEKVVLAMLPNMNVSRMQIVLQEARQ